MKQVIGAGREINGSFNCRVEEATESLLSRSRAATGAGHGAAESPGSGVENPVGCGEFPGALAREHRHGFR